MEPAGESSPVEPAGTLRSAAPPEPESAPTGRGTRAALQAVAAWLWRAPPRGARALARWSRQPAGRVALPAMVVAGLVAAAVTTGGVVVPVAAGDTGTPEPAPSASAVPPGGAAPSAAPSAGQPSTPGPSGSPRPGGLPADVLRGWAQQMSARTDVPVVALQAYGYAELVLTQTRPSCGISWTTLAAIGRVESNHGRTGAATLQSDGKARPPILGPPLDGEGDVELIEDTDGGALDGDPVYDRAVGPMQFIPESWHREQIDATGDQVADPHNIHDAALAAANYLCRQGRDMSTAGDWWSAVLAYNNVQAYAQQVFDAASEYGQRSRG